MKQLFILCLIACPLVFLGAQPGQGTVLLGTSTDLTSSGISSLAGCPNALGFTFVKTKYESDDHESEQKSTVFNVSASSGYFFTDELLIGAELSYLYGKVKDEDDALTSVTFGPLVRYYIPVVGILKPFAQAGANIGQISYGDSDAMKTNLSEFQIGVGGAIFLGEMTSLDLFLGYDYLVSKPKETDYRDKQTINTVGLGIGLSVFL